MWKLTAEFTGLWSSYEAFSASARHFKAWMLLLRGTFKKKRLSTCGKLLLASGFFLRCDVRMFLNNEHQKLLSIPFLFILKSSTV
jgi:hypothetical protein